MFEVGKTYKIFMYEGEAISERWNCTVAEVDMPLVKFDHAGTELIVNVSSKDFVSATPQ